MEIGASELTLSAAQGARVVALRLLDDAAAAAPKLEQSDADADALHDFRVALRRLRSWLTAFDDELGDVVPKKAVRRLKKLAHATNPGRDREVQLEWLEHAAGSARGSRRVAAEWLREHLRADDSDARDDLRAALRKHFPRARDAMVRALSRDVPTTDAGASPLAAPPTLAEAIADRIEAHLVALHEAAASIQSLGDEMAAHATRIAAKRLRYVVEPAREIDGARELLDQLRGLQDALGTLHDGHVMTHELRAVMEKSAVAEARLASLKALGRELVPAHKRDGDFAQLPRTGLVSLLRRLRDDIRGAYSDARGRYAGPAAEVLDATAARVEHGLRALHPQPAMTPMPPPDVAAPPAPEIP